MISLNEISCRYTNISIASVPDSANNEQEIRQSRDSIFSAHSYNTRCEAYDLRHRDNDD